VQARVLEIIAPARFEGYFAEPGQLLRSGGPPDPALRSQIAARYDLDLDLDRGLGLLERSPLRVGPPPAEGTTLAAG